MANFDLIHQSTHPFNSRVSFFLHVLPPLSSPPHAALLSELNLRIATLYFNQAINEQEACEWKTSKSTLESASRYVQDGLRWSGTDVFLRSQIEDLEERKRIHFSIADAVVVRDHADELFTKAMDTDEFLDLDKMWIIADMYKVATIHSHENGKNIVTIYNTTSIIFCKLS